MPKAAKLSLGSATSSKAKVKSTKKKSAKVKPSKPEANMASQLLDPVTTTTPTASTSATLDFESEAVHISKLEPDTPSLKKRGLFDATSRTITLLVGKEEIPFFIHENILCENYSFFESACKPQWMKEDDPMIRLPDDDPELVNIMLYWMYRHVLFFPAAFDTAAVNVSSGLDTAPGLLAKLFVLAEKYQIIPLQNNIIDAFLVWLGDLSLHHRIPASVIQYVWTNTISEDCLLREFLLDYVRAEYTFWDLKTVKDLIVENDFWYMLSRGQALTMDLVREALDGEGGERTKLEELRELVEDELVGDVCARWHQHGKDDKWYEHLKKYVLEEEEGDG
ncbi:hypothetical protein N431DRAFT_373589 [Stipitochalara longipes BDJ]|nr:hypothetical protein N431DRAFT_373589 [Stipitochalara longipes BDJ]